MNLRLEPRVDPPRWFSAVMTLAAVGVALLISGLVLWFVGGDPIRAFLHIARGRVRERRCPVRHAGQGDAAHPHRPRLFARLPDAPLEHRRGGPVPARGLGRQRRRPVPDPAGRHPGDRRDPGDDGRRRARRRRWGFIPGVLRARLGVNEIITSLMLNYIALSVDPVLGLRSVERGRLPADRDRSRPKPGCRG